MSLSGEARAIVVCSILERDVATAARRLREAPAGCGLLEIRGDCLRAEEIAALVRGSARPVVVSLRSAADGGRFEGSEEERGAGLRAALAAGARFVDVEWTSPQRRLVEQHGGERVILSHHGAACGRAELAAIYRELAATRAARLKLVPHARSPGEIDAVRETLAAARRDGRELACFAGGRAGALTRLLAPAWGSWASYGSAAWGQESAEGQFPAAELLELYDVTAIGPATRRFALIGAGVRASPSPAMHAAGYRAAGIDARYFPLEADDLGELLPLLGPGGTLGLAGLAVTLPFKSAACARCARLDPLARASGAVNTVLFGPGGWSGYNTDGPAALALVRDRFDVAGARVAIVGAGGTARAIAASLAGAGGRVSLFARSIERARQAAAALGAAARPLDELGRAEWDVLVQATPLGGRGERVLPAERLRGRLVLDAVYGVETPLVRDARARGLAAIDGFELLLAQAVRQFEILTGSPAAEAVLSRAGRAWLDSRAAP